MKVIDIETAESIDPSKVRPVTHAFPLNATASLSVQEDGQGKNPFFTLIMPGVENGFP